MTHHTRTDECARCRDAVFSERSAQPEILDFLDVRPDLAPHIHDVVMHEYTGDYAELVGSFLAEPTSDKLVQILTEAASTGYALALAHVYAGHIHL